MCGVLWGARAVVRARPMGQVREERARSHISSAPPRTTRTSESRDHLATSSRVEVDLDSVACTPPPHGSTGFGIWQWPQLLPAARHSTVRRRAACPGARRDLACSPRAGRGSVLLAKLLGGGLPLDPFGRAREQRASRVAGGDFLHLGQGNPTQRTAQGRRVGALGSKLRSLGVAG